MNKTVELVNEWADFEKAHPQNSIEDFCRYFLIKQREKANDTEIFEGVVPPHRTSLLTKLLVRIVRIYGVYFDLALAETGIRQSEEFYFLSVIKNLQSPKKTEVIHHTVNELSSGLNILASLISQGYIKERPDLEDKRAKRVSITPKGEKFLKICYEKVHAVSEQIFSGMPGEDIDLCIQLLKNVELQFASRWMQQSRKSSVKFNKSTKK